MRCSKFFTLLSLALLAVQVFSQSQIPPAGGKPKDFTLPAKTTFALDNGLAVTLVNYGSIPKVTVKVVIRSGNINESAQQVWLADLTGTLMKEGTTGRSAQEVAREAARMGGSISISAGEDRTFVQGEVLSEFGADLVTLLGDVVRNPRFPESELARLKNDQLRQLSIARSSPQSLAEEGFRKALYPDHPYGRIFPTEEIIKAFQIGDVRNFYDQNVGAARAHIYVAGRFDGGKIEDAIRKTFTGWRKGSEPLVNIPKSVSQRAIHLIDRPGAPQSTIYLGLSVPDPSQPDYRALLVTNALLGGSFASRITANIREDKGYTYSPFATVSPRYRDAYWLQVADVTTEVTGASLKEIFYEIERLRTKPPSADELNGIQNYLAGVFVLQNSSPAGIIGQLSFLDLHGLPESYLKDAVKNIYAVTPAQVQKITDSYIRARDVTIVIVGDRNKIEQQVTPFGKIEK